MATFVKKFARPADETTDEEELKRRRQERMRSHFAGDAAVERMGLLNDSAKAPVVLKTPIELPKAPPAVLPVSTSVVLPTPPPITRNALSIADNMAKLKDAPRYNDVIKELKTIKPHVPSDEMPVLPAPSISGSNALLIRNSQRGNPLVKFLRNVRCEYKELVPDFIMGRGTCAIFLSLRYHALYPNYIYERLKLLGKDYNLRVLLVQVDSKDPHHALKELTKIGILADCTLLLAWSAEEAAQHLESYKIFENKPPEILMKKQESDSYSKIIDALSSVRTINKSDAASVMAKFGTFAGIANASREDLEVCPGMGPKKARDLYSALHKPFLKQSPQRAATSCS